MEGACVFIDKQNVSNLLMYKEIPDKIIFFAWYKLKRLNIGYISIYDYYKLVPAKSIHILNHLPYLDKTSETLDLWKSLSLNKLNMLNGLI